MALYSDGAMDNLASVTSMQMESYLVASYASTNEAMVNSNIDLVLDMVHIGKVNKALSSLLPSYANVLSSSAAWGEDIVSRHTTATWILFVFES